MIVTAARNLRTCQEVPPVPGAADRKVGINHQTTPCAPGLPLPPVAMLDAARVVDQLRWMMSLSGGV